MSVVHGSCRIRCVDGQYRPFHTLCGLTICGADQIAATAEAVTCKVCRKSRSWQPMVDSLKEMHRAASASTATAG